MILLLQPMSLTSTMSSGRVPDAISCWNTGLIALSTAKLPQPGHQVFFAYVVSRAAGPARREPRPAGRLAAFLLRGAHPSTSSACRRSSPTPHGLPS